MKNSGFYINGEIVTNEVLAGIMVKDFLRIGENIFNQLFEIAKNETKKEPKSVFKWLVNRDIIKNECLGFSASLLLLMIYDINDAPVEKKHEMNKEIINTYYQIDVEMESALKVSEISVNCLKAIASEWAFEKIIPGGFNSEAGASHWMAKNILQ